MMNLTRLAPLLLLLCIAGCVPALPREAAAPAGTFRVTVETRYQVSHRDFLLHIPPGYRSDRPLPLVVVLHGAFGTGRQMERETGFSKLADTENFLVAYPEGIGLLGFLQHWNAGHCCGRAADEGVDDVAFIAEVIATAGQRVAVDSQRIYLAGMSNGGMLAYRYAVERPGDLAAAAVVSGAFGSSTAAVPFRAPPLDGDALPMLIVHGTTDDHIPWEGGISPRSGGERSFLSGGAAIDYWRRRDRCREEGETFNPGINRILWTDCAQGSTVEAHLLIGWGHVWPGPRGNGDRHLLEAYPYDAAVYIWDFFHRFTRQDGDSGRGAPASPEKLSWSNAEVSNARQRDRAP